MEYTAEKHLFVPGFNRKSIARENEMEKTWKGVIMRSMKFLHFSLMLTAMMAVWTNIYMPMLNLQSIQAANVSVCACYALLLIFFYRDYHAYKIDMYRAWDIFYSQMLANLFSNAVTYVLACIFELRLLNCLPVLLILTVQALISAGWCALADRLYFRLYKPLRTLLIYRNAEDLEKLHEIVCFERRFDVRGMMKNPPDAFAILPEITGYQAVAISGLDAAMRNGVVKECIAKDIACYFIPHTGDVIVAGAKHAESFSIPMMEARRAVLRPEYAFVKRAMDIALSAIGLVAASPLMLGTAIAIKAYDHGPVIYRQQRLTKDRRRFEILKFRSMRMDAEKDGVARLAADHDDRITPVGRFIRAIRFDELPQLFNILRGDMSIVGPRPERSEIAAQYERDMPAFSLRLQVKAGLTGTAQVYGRYNTEPDDKLKMDLMYINSMSLMEDLKLIFATVRILFVKESTAGIKLGQVTAVKQEEQSSVEKTA